MVGERSQRHRGTIPLNFDPEFCRNESEVESKLIVQYLLPKLGYTPDTWHQEVTFGKIRLDFLAFAMQKIPLLVDANSPLSVVLEAKHPKQNLNRHTRRLKRYLLSLNVRYGLLTNGRELRIYEKVKNEIQLLFHCDCKNIESHLEDIKAILGRESLKNQNFQPDYPASLTNSKIPMKTIAVYHNKGGVGKTTTVVNLAAALRNIGKRVLIVDLDSQANTTFATGLIKTMFDDENLDDIKDNNIYHILRSTEFNTIPEIAKKSSFNSEEIDVIPSHINLMKTENELNQMRSSQNMLSRKLKQVEAQYDIVLIDTPPSLNLFAYIALLTADYLIIPSDLKPFANQGLLNVKDFINEINNCRDSYGKPNLEILGVLPCKISTNARFVQYSLPRQMDVIPKRYGFNLMDTVIYQRNELSACLEQYQYVGDMQIPDPRSVFDFKPDGDSAREFELLADEVLHKIGMA